MTPLTSWKLHQETHRQGRSFNQESVVSFSIPLTRVGKSEGEYGGLQPSRKEGFLCNPEAWNHYVFLAFSVPIGVTSHLSQIGVFDYLASFAAYFCILSVWGGKLFGPKPRGIGKNGEWLLPFREHLKVRSDLHTHIYSTHTCLILLKTYTWCTHELHVDALGGK